MLPRECGNGRRVRSFYRSVRLKRREIKLYCYNNLIQICKDDNKKNLILTFGCVVNICKERKEIDVSPTIIRSFFQRYENKKERNRHFSL